MTATSVQYIGLTFTYASSFQMLRGAVIIFTGDTLHSWIVRLEHREKTHFQMRHFCYVLK